MGESFPPIFPYQEWTEDGPEIVGLIAVQINDSMLEREVKLLFFNCRDGELKRSFS